MKRAGSRTTILLLAPWILTLVVFWLFPLLYSLYLSFTRYKTLTNEVTWIGLSNYIKLFSDPAFTQSLRNTLIFVIGTIPFTMIFALLFAAALNNIKRFQYFFRSALFLPSVTSLIVIALIFTNLYSADGYINKLMSMAGITGSDKGWLLEPNYALPSIMIMDIWISIGYYAVLFLAAMQNVPRDYYEVAALEGSSKWQVLWRITLPLIKPTILFAVVLNTIKSFQVFAEIYVMTKGGPLGCTTTLVYSIYDNAFGKANGMGYASAIAYILFFIIAIFSAVEFNMLKESENGGKRRLRYLFLR
jgi:multiple sugar transport system permease protein